MATQEGGAVAHEAPQVRPAPRVVAAGAWVVVARRVERSWGRLPHIRVRMFCASRWSSRRVKSTPAAICGTMGPSPTPNAFVYRL